MSMKATIQEMEKMIGLLEKQREILPRYSLLGTDNWWVIDSQIQILKCAINGESPSEDDLDEMEGWEYDVVMWILDPTAYHNTMELME
jgi:hypothetical protein